MTTILNRRFLPGLLASFGWAISVSGLLAQSSIPPLPGTPWPATDGLGRALPLASEVGPVRKDAWVGIFYFLWHEKGMAPKRPNGEGPYDLTKIFNQDPDALKKPDSPLWGGIGVSHYWGEPVLGYYLSADPWVLRRHAKLLADAGVDTLIFDTTNALSYRDVYMALCEVFRAIRKEGGQTPCISFMVNTRAGETAKQIYRDLYKPGLYKELWFLWQGKPLMICDAAEADPELKEFFSLRRAHWPFTLTNTPYAWHWEATYPQPYGYTDDPARPEQVNVSVAQNLRQADGKVTNMSFGDARGRSFKDGVQHTNAGSVLHGYNFGEQWQRGFELRPPFVMVTGWNEWIAGRWGKKDGPIVFVDQFDQEFSRDIEPMKGGHEDNYYWQLVANVRRFKGAPALPVASPLKSIKLEKDFSQWNEVKPEYRDSLNETVPRDYAGAGGTHYTNCTGLNDIVSAKVARDRSNLYFYLRTREQVMLSTNALWLVIDNGAPGGEASLRWLIRMDAGGKFGLSGQAATGEWKTVAELKGRVKGNELHLSIPRKAVGLKEVVSFRFKWLDNVQRPFDPMDYYVSGDVAPEGRLFYVYRER